MKNYRFSWYIQAYLLVRKILVIEYLLQQMEEGGMTVKELGSSWDKGGCFGEAQKYFVKENCSDCGLFAKNV